ncbi:glyoxylate/hydroxypyruvate reductase A [Maribius pontilimi]|uniref:Glyoxylate/hydroxypyruvate reductase A n=1 Tax=Palleronia pontilimi TaxID=1964209 RepID=A0A934MDK8_9RHOB|nr:glyoxylate/hydroxypyruvate reductase A [Palleronia pontilimi]MBJ3762481.1 glyoxylate/hydroxypyruvate reductase A [Palleronia pontilimi]
MSRPRVLFSAKPERWDETRAPLLQAARDAGLPIDLAKDHPPQAVDYIVYAPNGGLQDFTPFTRLKAVLNLWAGVEDVVDNPTLTVPLARMVDPSLTEGMIDYVTAHVLRHHMGLDAHIGRAPGDWDPVPPPLARDRRVTILGLGALGAACAEALAGLNFDVAGWSRTDKTLPGIRAFHGSAGLNQALHDSEISVLLLPHTPATDTLIDATRLAQMPAGAVLINPGRGALIDDAALLSALDAGHLSHATLDTFRTEPLPAHHPFWHHPRVTVTPHIASVSRPESCARVIVENIRRAEHGEPLLHLVDRDAGY